jgi:hypothetical protein
MKKAFIAPVLKAELALGELTLGEPPCIISSCPTN